MLSAQLVGDERAVAAMVAALGQGREPAAVIPVVQPAALPAGLTKGVKHQGKALKSLRGELATATGVEDVPPLKIKRLSLLNIGMLIGVLFAVGIAFHSMEGINWASVKGEFENATWALGGARPRPLPAGPDVVGHRAHGLREQGPAVRPDRADPARVQLPQPDHAERHRRHRAADRLPAQAGRAGGVGRERDGAQHRRRRRDPDDPVPQRGGDHRDRGRHEQQQRLVVGTTTLWIIVAVAVAIGIVLFIPKIKNKVVPAVKRARQRHLGRACATRRRRCSSSAATPPAT